MKKKNLNINVVIYLRLESKKFVLLSDVLLKHLSKVELMAQSSLVLLGRIPDVAEKPKAERIKSGKYLKDNKRQIV